MKRLLIISPYFPPSNAADMQRIRMSLPYFREFGWEAEVVTVDPKHSDLNKDPLLHLSIDAATPIHYVGAFAKKWTSKLGLGSIALRSLLFYKMKVNRILRTRRFDLIYFSTTQFPICVLGAYWKKKFGMPYVIDMQDPWHSNFYKNKPKEEQPAKYWFTYRLHKYLEPLAMNNVHGIISVSASYIEQLKGRYPNIREVPCKVLTFGYYEKDFDIAKKHASEITLAYQCEAGKTNLVYIGRGGFDMAPAATILFKAFAIFLKKIPELAKDVRFHFIGTSYAPTGMGKLSFLPIAESLGLEQYVYESSDRVSFYESIRAMQSADALIIPGSNDPAYTASKIYPYLLSGKPILGLFQQTSSAYSILKESSHIATDFRNEEQALQDALEFLTRVSTTNIVEGRSLAGIELYSAKNMTKQQCAFFNTIC